MRVSTRISLFAYVALGAIPLLSQQPSIVAIENNYSYTRPTVPNYGIAPGSIFLIFGSNLSTVTVPVLQSSVGPGVPLTLDGVSIAVTVNGQTAPVPLYYVSATQIAGILPSTMPAGTGTITVTNNGQTSAPAPIQVVSSDFGILTRNNGSGPAGGYDGHHDLITGTNSASPGQTIVLWGSGVGADRANDDRIFPQKQNNLTNIPIQVFIGGVSAHIVYRGRSQFPGLDQINVTVPQAVATGCYVSLIVMSGNYVSNSATLPISPNGGTCSDPNTQFTTAQLQALSTTSNVNVGTIFIDEETNVSKNVVKDLFRAKFLSYPPGQYEVKTPSDGFISYGSCVITAPDTSSTHLNAGPALTVSGPGGEQASASLTTLKDGTLGDYKSTLPAGFIPSGGGTFTFSNGSGSSAVGGISNASITLPSPIVWTNMSGISSVNRSEGLTVTWSGGSPSSFVVIQGSATVAPPGTDSVAFTCAASSASGQFTIPPSLLLAMPTGGRGELSVNSVAFPSPFSAPGLNLGAVFAELGSKIFVVYQ